MAEIDWRTLLLKYMAHVEREEGSAFVPRYGSEIVFTADELAALEAMDKADITQYRAPGGYMQSDDFPK